MQINQIGTDNLNVGILICISHFTVRNRAYRSYVILVKENLICRGIYHFFISVPFSSIYYYLSFILEIEINLLSLFGIIISRIVSKTWKEIFI